MKGFFRISKQTRKAKDELEKEEQKKEPVALEVILSLPDRLSSSSSVGIGI